MCIRDRYCEIWGHEWEVIENRYLEANDRPERVDLRSYARQGVDIIPTVHEGAAVRQMEKRGIQTNIDVYKRQGASRASGRLWLTAPVIYPNEQRKRRNTPNESVSYTHLGILYE